MSVDVKSLLSNCTSGGCGAKIGPGDLSGILSKLPKFYDENLSVGYDSSDDAAVYKIDNENSIVSTVDFFSPMIDDAKLFGKIAAANSLSDVYAMGGKPLFALNLVCFPQSMDLSVLGEILEGGAEKVSEASAVLAGGHSIYDKEPKYGLSVTGIVKNDKVLLNDTARETDKLILTKPLGVGIVLAAHRGEQASEKALSATLDSMQRLNKYAAEKMIKYDVSACTDITGFGFLGHLIEMASDRVSLEIYKDEIPYIEESYKYAEEFLLTAAGQRNRNHIGDKCDVSKLPFALQELVFDPQTSGGLLIAVNKNEANMLLDEIRSEDPKARIVGEVIKRQKDLILF